LLHAQWANNGPGWVAVLLPSAQQVLAIEPDYEAMRGLWVGVVGAYPSGSECQFEVRAFVPNETSGGWEDPVTGSLNASVAQWLIGAGLAPERYIASQGTVLGRAGRVKLMRDGAGQVWVGGAVVTCVSGAVLL
jgi:predicted PhzF superfamily epimerase YddE/YHI9